MNINRLVNEQLWKVVPEFSGYEAHPNGMIRNAITGKIVGQQPYGGSTVKYMLCNMRNDIGEWKRPSVHRIIAVTFINQPAIENEYDWDVDHIDHNTSNNAVDNLRWLPATLNRALTNRVRPEIARRKILDYYREHNIEYDFFNLLSEL